MMLADRVVLGDLSLPDFKTVVLCELVKQCYEMSSEG
jgi:hypothetical protein